MVGMLVVDLVALSTPIFTSLESHSQQFRVCTYCPCILQVEFLAQHIKYFHFLFTNAMFHSKVRAHLKIKIP